MDDNWGYPDFGKPPKSVCAKCFTHNWQLHPLENFLEGLRGLSFTESIPSPKEENSSRSETSELKEPQSWIVMVMQGGASP